MIDWSDGGERGSGVRECRVRDGSEGVKRGSGEGGKGVWEESKEMGSEGGGCGRKVRKWRVREGSVGGE